MLVMRMEGEKSRQGILREEFRREGRYRVGLSWPINCVLPSSESHCAGYNTRQIPHFNFGASKVRRINPNGINCPDATTYNTQISP